MLKMLRNISSNYLRAVVDGLVIILLTPVVVRTLGIELYALWIIVQTLAYYLGFLDLGVAEAQVQRHSVLQAEGRTRELGRLHGTVLTFFLGAGAIAFIMAAAIPVLPSAALFDVPADAQALYATALMLAGAALFFSFTDAAFNGIFEGHQRYDLMNWVNIAVGVVEAVSIYVVLSLGHGLIGLAAVKAGAEAVRVAAKLLTLWRFFPPGTVPRPCFDAGAWRSIRSFSLWNSLNDIVTEGTAHLDKLLIPILLGSALVTPYSLVVLLAAAIFVVAEPITDTYLPIAAARHARKDPVAVAMLLMRGTKLVNMATLPILLVVLCFGQSILALWIGEVYTQVAPSVLWLTAVNFYFSTFLWTSLSVMMGAGLVRRIFLMSLLEVAIVLGLILVLVPRLGLTGIALAGLIGNVLVGLKVFVVGACRLGQLEIVPFLNAALLRPLTGAVPALVLGLWIGARIGPETWLGVVLGTGATGLLCAAGVVIVSTSRWERARWYATARRLVYLTREGIA